MTGLNTQFSTVTQGDNFQHGLRPLIFKTYDVDQTLKRILTEALQSIEASTSEEDADQLKIQMVNRIKSKILPKMSGIINDANGVLEQTQGLTLPLEQQEVIGRVELIRDQYQNRWNLINTSQNFEGVLAAATTYSFQKTTEQQNPPNTD